MRFWKLEDDQAFRDVVLQPIGEILMFIAIACDETTQFGLCGFEVLGVPDVAELFADLFSDLVIRRRGLPHFGPGGIGIAGI